MEAGKTRGHRARTFTPGRESMSKIMKPLSVAVGVAFVGSLAIAQAASASSFALSDMDGGYQQVGEGHDHDKAAEGKCGEGKCGEGKCGMDKLDTDKNGSISATEFAASGHPAEKFTALDADKNGAVTQAEMDAHHKAMEGKCGEGKCGEGKCGADKTKAEGKCGEGKCGADKTKAEGKCGEGKCGGDKDKKEGACGGSL
jgi:uncharacterized low-complexity protein